MSILVGLKHNGVVYIGGDREVSNDSGMVTSSVRVWEVPKSGGMILGCIGSVDIISQVKNAKLFDNSFLTSDEFSHDFVRNTLARRISFYIKHYVDNDEAYCEDENGDWLMNAQFLVARGDLLFSIDSNGKTIEIDDFCTLGSGASTAFNSLMASNGEQSPTERIEKAFSACAESVGNVEYPISTVNTGVRTLGKGFLFKRKN